MPADLKILTQRLPVSVRTVSSKEGTKHAFLEYQCWLPQDPALRDPVIVDVHKDMLRSLVKDVRVEIDRLIDLAKAGKSRGSEGVEAAAEALARHVLPPRGLADVVAQGMHPQFHTIADAAGQIPSGGSRGAILLLPQRSPVGSAPAGGHRRDPPLQA